MVKRKNHLANVLATIFVLIVLGLAVTAVVLLVR